jgi:hypothetical protein
MRRILWIATLAALMGPLLAVDAEAIFKKLGTTGFNFVKIGQSARPVAMGSAYMAISNDINSIFWNPAGLTHIERAAYTFSYNRWFADSKLYSGAVAYRFGASVFGVSMVSFQTKPFEETTIFEPTGTGKMVEGNDFAIGVAYAYQFTDRLSFGANFRYLQESLFEDSNTTFDASVGTLFYTGFRNSRLAMTLKNFGQDNTVIAESAFMPVVYTIAGAMEVVGKVGDPTYLTLSAENVFAIDYEGRVHLGAELWLVNTLALRGGYKWNYDAEDFSIGAGLKRTFGTASLSVDIAYTHSDFFNAPLRFTVNGTF